MTRGRARIRRYGDRLAQRAVVVLGMRDYDAETVDTATEPDHDEHQLEHAIRTACQIIQHTEVIVVGSQAILGTYAEDELPAAATMSVEVDILPIADSNEETARLADLIEGVAGEFSSLSNSTASASTPGPGSGGGAHQRHRVHDRAVSQGWPLPPPVEGCGTQVSGNRSRPGAGGGVERRTPVAGGLRSGEMLHC